MHSTLTFKQDTLYAAYAAEFDVGAWGTCEDEALNNLTDEIQQRQTANGLGNELRDKAATSKKEKEHQ